MHRDHQNSGFSGTIAAIVLGALLGGCGTVGPNAIGNGRLTYNEAIVATDNQQMLMLAVHNRYEERGNLLAVSSVTANVKMTTRASIEVGVGNEEYFAGNLVPFGAGVIYEENPTISYTPVGGEKYARQLFSPVSIEVLAQYANTLTNPAGAYMALVASVNGIYNPDFLSGTMEADPRFARFVTLVGTLEEAHRLHWIEASNRTDSLSIFIDRSSPGFENEIDELLSLLGLPAASDEAQSIILPVVRALDGRESGGVGITTRSVWELIEILSAAIDVPEEDLKNSIAATYPASGAVGRDLRVRVSDKRPDSAYIAVEHRGHWFYIDESDQLTKRFFRITFSLLGVAISESAVRTHAAPVLTVPVN